MTITTRNDIGKLYQAHYVTGHGAEIGVKEGWNALQIMRYYEGTVHMIDIWKEPKEMMQTMLNAWTRYVGIYRTTSARAARMFGDGELDWVYIDADHTYESVSTDHALWAPKVRKGGIVSGHDYSPEFPGVMQMVDELTDSGIEIHLTKDDVYEGIGYFSWWYVK